MWDTFTHDHAAGEKQFAGLAGGSLSSPSEGWQGCDSGVEGRGRGTGGHKVQWDRVFPENLSTTLILQPPYLRPPWWC